ncbi:conserved hypothetical protein [Neospora caninum Liverpool]|uniref:Uncharacterized protein n=1 Tax=Neospora caninum (strain Liverpool) TaxID=572307 RepID=F0V8L7_NEOCL|nr:conserved hypothetical protein [Neospora caninum Liverpool]CBZ50058.1 conserved hypothetical protein [Neospora caninum Liverpool]CEL64652.1 TPA: hypothetical protein BN1204_005340 [Neospora caninum Liverpool]|eukprot:XP_003880093.1 conserved hypothetical protein [Neospora caninum Liverpool]
MAEEDNTLQIVTGASATKSLSEAAHSPLIKWEWTSVNLSIPGLPTRPLRSAERVGLDTRVVPSPAVPGAFHIPPKADLEKNVVVAYHPQVHNKNVSYRIETKPLHATYRNLAVKHHQALRMGADFVAKMNVKGFWFPPPPEGVSPAPLVHLIDEKMTAFDLAPGASDILTQRNENLQVQATAAFMSQMTAWSLGRWLMTRKHSP